ncbi:MAG: Phosphoribosylglycinamide formyltransferase [Firmicutes bacterium]|nr:Phosphoribosylglycinamide formyltransferase [Bacillota bacterium]MDI6706167.1 phosphoribosylglycinamide formyltransferase [Bacillota bacterium]
MEYKRIAVLASGRGSNLQSVIDGIESGYINNAKIMTVISDNREAFALERARAKGIEGLWLNPGDFASYEDYNNSIIEKLENLHIDLVVLAGYMKILSKGFVQTFQNRIINIHPSLIPSFCGVGYYGEKVHRAVLEYGVKITGATVHFVDEGADTGPIILQEAVKVYQDDTVGSLAKRVLEVEHRLLPEAVRLFCNEMLCIDGRRVYIKDGGAL